MPPALAGGFFTASITWGAPVLFTQMLFFLPRELREAQGNQALEGTDCPTVGWGAGEKAQAKFVTLFPPLSFPEVSLASSPHSPWAIFSLSTPSQGLFLTCPVSTAHPIPNLTISVCFWLM